METEQETPVKKAGTAKTILTIILGAIAIALGCSTFIANDEINNALVEVGALQTATSVIELKPEYKDSFATVADVLDAAVAARDANPEKLAEMLQEALQSKLGPMDIRPIVKVTVRQLNDAYKASATESRYLERVTYLAKGFREAATAE